MTGIPAFSISEAVPEVASRLNPSLCSRSARAAIRLRCLELKLTKIFPDSGKTTPAESWLFAKAKANLLSQPTKIVLGIHPSPLARGFLGSGVFRKVESALGEPVNWSL